MNQHVSVFQGFFYLNFKRTAFHIAHAAECALPPHKITSAVTQHYRVIISSPSKRQYIMLSFSLCYIPIGIVTVTGDAGGWWIIYEGFYAMK